MKEKEKKTNSITEQFNDVVEQYVNQFAEKHSYDFEGWVGDWIGTIASFGDYTISFDVVRYDIDNNVDSSYFVKWWDNQDRINYPTFCREMDRQKNSPIQFDVPFWTTEFLTSITKPSYYKAGSIDVIDFCFHHELGFSEGNVVKYVVRAGKKSEKTRLEDLNKALEYLNRIIQNGKINK